MKQINKKIIFALLCFVMLLIMAGCQKASQKNSDSDSQPIESELNSETPVQELETESDTRIISTTTGDIEVPVNPQRVVVQYLMGDVVRLGIIPVGVSDVYDGAAFAELVTDSVGLGWFPEWEEESIMVLDPDLILVISADDVERYSKIAPTILIPYDIMTQDERITFIGEVLNRQEEAAKVIEEYNTNLEAAKDKLLQAGIYEYTVSVFEGGADSAMSVKGDQYGTGAMLYRELGLKAPEAVKTNIIDKNSGGEQVSFEALNQYSGDFIVRNTYEGMADLSQDAIWNTIPAVVNNRIIGIEFGLSYYPDIYSATAQLDYVTEALISLVK